jgi:hypothetical protein
MSKINDGGPAFPVLDNPGDGALYCRAGGMSLRDWFAGQALNAMLADPGRFSSAAGFSADAYAVADAMIAAREGGEA